MRKITVLLLALLLVASLCFTVSAHDVPVERDDCTIEIRIRYNGENVDGGTLTVIKVGYVDEEDGNYFFSRVGDDALLEDVASADAVAALEKYYADNKGSISFETQTADAKEGICQFSGLSTGLYLVIQQTPAPGFSALNASLVSVPQLVDGVYEYNISVAIKSELKREDPTDPTPTTPSGPQLPQTGQLNWPIVVMAVVGMLMFLLGWVTYSKTAKKIHEE